MKVKLTRKAYELLGREIIGDPADGVVVKELPGRHRYKVHLRGEDGVSVRLPGQSFLRLRIQEVGRYGKS